MSDIKKSWQDVGDDFGKAFTNLGKTLIKSVVGGVKKAEEWANSETGQKKPETEENKE